MSNMEMFVCYLRSMLWLEGGGNLGKLAACTVSKHREYCQEERPRDLPLTVIEPWRELSRSSKVTA